MAEAERVGESIRASRRIPATAGKASLSLRAGRVNPRSENQVIVRANDLHVLLRHRPRSISPPGQELSVGSPACGAGDLPASAVVVRDCVERDAYHSVGVVMDELPLDTLIT